FPQGYDAERNALTQQGHGQHRAEALQAQRFWEMIVRVRLDVGNLDRTTLQQRATSRGLRPCADRGALPELQDCGRIVVVGGGTAAFSVIAKNHAVFGIAKADRGLQQCLKNALEIERRSTDSFEHLGGSSLLLKRL